jgi:hypothetical protein
MNAEEKRGTLAVLALIFGIAGVVISWAPVAGFLGLALSIAAIVMGAIALSRIKRGESSETGKSFAAAGLILGIIGVIVSVVFIILFTMVLGGLLGYFGGWSFFS